MASTSQTTDIKEFNIYEKYGHFHVVSASVHILISFVLRKLGFLSIQDEKVYKSVIAWSNSQIKNIIAFREKIKDLISEITDNYSSSNTAAVLGCEKKYTEKGDYYCYSHWYSSKNIVPDHIIQENNILLKEAKITYLLNQICFRLQRTRQWIKRSSNCVFDFTVLDFLQKEHHLFDTIKEEAFEMIDDKLESIINKTPQAYTPKIKALSESNQKTPHVTASRKVTSEIINAPKKSVPTKKVDILMKPKKLDFDQKQTQISYAKIVKESKSIDHSNPVDDLNEDMPVPKQDEPVKESEPQIKLIDITKETICPYLHKKLLQTKEKNVPKCETLIDLSKEEPTESLELLPSAECCKTLRSKDGLQVQPEEMIQIQILTFKDGKPIISPIIMNKKDYHKIPILSLTK